MHILCLSGSASDGSSNILLLRYLKSQFAMHQFQIADYLKELPLFYDGCQPNSTVETFKSELQESDVVIISSPAYLHNIPALLKNAFEWVTASGEFYQKKVLAIIYTPNFPRGEKAMSSLTNSLKALDCQIVATLLLHHTDLCFEEEVKVLKKDNYEMLLEAVRLLA